MIRPRSTVLLCLLAVPLFAADDPIRVQQGQVSGAPGRSPDIRVYKGIPYAAPPVGDLRWKAPKAPVAWTGVKQATSFSPVCFQTPYPTGSLYYSAPEQTSEDCLALNVWTPAKRPNEKRPVMVWIHGGALTRGSGSTPLYDGENLAKKGVVVVTINYRLGLLGFYAHPDLTKESDRNSSGNYGILDQVAALEWVKQNIAAFGGDPSNVTIFGESAGSWSVNLLTATPLAHGLFQRAIGESGAEFQPMKKLALAEQDGVKFATAMKANSLADLRAIPAADLVKRMENNQIGPVVDGYLLPQDVNAIYTKGKQNDVAAIVGYNSDEGTSLAPYPKGGTSAAFIEAQRKRFGAQADDFLKTYPSSTDQEAESAHYNSLRDMIFGWQMRTWARLETQTGKSKVWMYYFNHTPPGPESSRYRAYHASEIAYAFNNLEAGRPWADADRKIADEMSSYWTNFAKTGDPNGGSLPRWPNYQAKSDNLLRIGDSTLEPATEVNRAGLDFLDRYYTQLRSTTP